MPKTLLSITIAATLLLTSACQFKSGDKASSVEPATNIDEPNTQLLPEVSASKNTDAAALNSAVDAQTCLNLNKAMKEVDDTSKIEAIYEAQNQLKACLPTASNKEVLTLLETYQAMYGRFLDFEDSGEDNDFYKVMSSIDEGEEVPKSSLNALNPRLKYLVKLVESKSDVGVLYLGEGYYEFDHNLADMAAIFSPYLLKDQKAFVQRMAMDNQGILWNDGGIAISFDEVIERAKFWESYLKTYPNGYAYQDAKNLFNLYRDLIIFGSDNTQWTDDTIHGFLAPEYQQSIIKLARRPNSLLAKDAQALLDFTTLSDGARQQKYPTPAFNEEGYEMSEWAIARYQLRKAIPIPSPWNENNKDCSSGVICVENMN